MIPSALSKKWKLSTAGQKLHPRQLNGLDFVGFPISQLRVLPQFVWRNYPELGTFGRDSRDF
ncbi:hypothetical protein PXK01_21715, partial [Phaeobacter sp. PT47_59]|uniref:hypothetical protein n=1 Tax=Phaeobacter sp. PT47_59 TaxID=3029979 RepID=UPI002380A993